MIRKNIINVGLGLILVWLVVGVIKMNNTTDTQSTKSTKDTTTENSESIEDEKAEREVWLSPDSQELEANQDFDIEVVMGASDKNIGAFNLNLNFDTDKINIDTTKGIDVKVDTGRGFDKGADAEEYIIMSNSEEVNEGRFRLAGMGITKATDKTEKHMIVIHAKTTDSFTEGKTEITLKVGEFSDTLGKAIATKKNVKATVAIK